MSLGELHESLETALDEGMEIPAGEERERFVIDGPKTADWALRKLGRVRRRIADAEMLAEDRRRSIDEWLSAQRTRVQHDVDYFVGLLEQWHRAELADDPRVKTISLPSGELTARKAPDTVDVVDIDTFAAWATLSGHADLVRTKVEPDKTAIRKRLAMVIRTPERAGLDDGPEEILVDPETGEAVPGVQWIAGAVRFSAKTRSES